MSRLFLATLLEGGDSFTVEREDGTIVLERIPGMEDDFNAIAQLVLARSDFAVFPRSDDSFNYDRLLIFPLPFDARDCAAPTTMN